LPVILSATRHEGYPPIEQKKGFFSLWPQNDYGWRPPFLNIFHYEEGVGKLKIYGWTKPPYRATFSPLGAKRASRLAMRWRVITAELFPPIGLEGDLSGDAVDAKPEQGQNQEGDDVSAVEAVAIGQETEASTSAAGGPLVAREARGR